MKNCNNPTAQVGAPLHHNSDSRRAATDNMEEVGREICENNKRHIQSPFQYLTWSFFRTNEWKRYLSSEKKSAYMQKWKKYKPCIKIDQILAKIFKN